MLRIVRVHLWERGRHVAHSEGPPLGEGSLLRIVGVHPWEREATLVGMGEGGYLVGMGEGGYPGGREGYLVYMPATQGGHTTPCYIP